ncbi:conserved hypothetical protein [Hoeflea sp. EC-HK425]|nr:conserved hypothetical protein [Hoeflea sp. EC-HK425]
MIRGSIFSASMFIVPGSTSAKMGVAPRSTTALAVDVNVKEGMMTSSPGPRSSSNIAISSAAVQECVRNALLQLKWRCSIFSHSPVKCPSPLKSRRAIASEIVSSSDPVMSGLLKGISTILMYLIYKLHQRLTIRGLLLAFGKSR